MTWRFSKEVAGSGSLGDLASHILDIGRFLVGEPNRVMGMKKTFIDERPDGQGGRATVDVDDAVTALLEFENGALGTIEATRFAIGHRNGNMWEVNARTAASASTSSGSTSWTSTGTTAARRPSASRTCSSARAIILTGNTGGRPAT